MRCQGHLSQGLFPYNLHIGSGSEQVLTRHLPARRSGDHLRTVSEGGSCPFLQQGDASLHVPGSRGRSGAATPLESIERQQSRSVEVTPKIVPVNGALLAKPTVSAVLLNTQCCVVPTVADDLRCARRQCCRCRARLTCSSSLTAHAAGWCKARTRMAWIRPLGFLIPAAYAALLVLFFVHIWVSPHERCACTGSKTWHSACLRSSLTAEQWPSSRNAMFDCHCEVARAQSHQAVRRLV